MSENLRRTPLYETHLRSGARLVPFAGWEMPVQYTGVVAEVKAVREATGIFDVSHMGRVWVEGPQAEAFLDYLTVNDVSKLTDGQGQYSLMCYESGGVVDDIIVYRISATGFFVVINAGNRDKDLAWMREKLAGFDATLTDRSDETGLIAVQGPKALELLRGMTQDAIWMGRFQIATVKLGTAGVDLARTGYTGEDGAELVCRADQAALLWDSLIAAGALACGLGARDALRLEAALPLYGHEMDETVNPYEARLGWVVKLDKAANFIGKDVLQAVKASGPARKCVGITLEGKGIPREGYPVCVVGGAPVGHITSGTFSPTVGRGVAMARVESAYAKTGTALEVEIRGARHAATVAALPFYKNV
ncbi:glycine cleavage system aminomethyltransferase GcvT [Armatimonas rosea]|uniref:Aminomethyltransferase n=1 Tax=Armatimonas rosea TaxID=685828 RepID=A0A7W9STH0_ARMRO|nr:glycine cleavage system aminomethyltransferase GcvT [Armatimonas rosea]MBB6052550.1 aminomethyltransferase [Armatimonas rosea]